MDIVTIYLLVVLVLTLGAWAQHPDLPLWTFPFLYVGVAIVTAVGIILFALGLFIVFLSLFAGYTPKTGTPSVSPPQSDYGTHHD